MREDLLIEINKLAREGRFDYLIIENTGVGEPMQVAETFTFGLGTEGSDVVEQLNDVARLDTCVTVVDAANFRSNWISPERVTERFEEAGEEDERNVVSSCTRHTVSQRYCFDN